eukprot:TRINITY_DN22938_c0_g1_i1.p1 TRINITY_DN22938_c0_g1~~TRINITY_DN22938_c0_g1_i1.p1  ORF type:complete len:120 (+),score=18.16 TRINITY_DN22938_c0_g1_i1:39-362(+)
MTPHADHLSLTVTDPSGANVTLQANHTSTSFYPIGGLHAPALVYYVEKPSLGIWNMHLTSNIRPRHLFVPDGEQRETKGDGYLIWYNSSPIRTFTQAGDSWFSPKAI